MMMFSLRKFSYLFMRRPWHAPIPELTDGENSRKLERKRSRRKAKKAQRSRGTTQGRSRAAGNRTGPPACRSGQGTGDLHRHAAQLAESLRGPDGAIRQTQPGAAAHPGAGSVTQIAAQTAGRERRGHRRPKKTVGILSKP